jgi:hypothetical protein
MRGAGTDGALRRVLGIRCTRFFEAAVNSAADAEEDVHTRRSLPGCSRSTRFVRPIGEAGGPLPIRSLLHSAYALSRPTSTTRMPSPKAWQRRPGASSLEFEKAAEGRFQPVARGRTKPLRRCSTDAGGAPRCRPGSVEVEGPSWRLTV